MGAKSLFLPRTLNRVRCLSDEELEWVRTASDVYWITVNSTLNEDLRPQDRDSNLVAGIELNQRKLLPLLAALAFTAVESDGGPQTDFFDEGEALDKFLDRAKTLYDTGRIRSSNQLDFNQGLKQLCELNLEAFSMVVDEYDNKNLVKFSDPTLRDFLAALWVARFAIPDDLRNSGFFAIECRLWGAIDRLANHTTIFGSSCARCPASSHGQAKLQKH